ncbi:MAG: phage integrase N-terminal SAM-like domain-containing protein [Cryomorphaceae bacterium]|nr:phage integrase N-terminal SAM-like domain-containing protein [Cryomorphaceae bacterium]
MTEAGLKALLQLEKTMVVSHLASRSVVAYSREVRFMIEFYPDMDPMDWTEDLVVDYLHYLINEKQASRSKCHMVAQSLAYFIQVHATIPPPGYFGDIDPPIK